ncbi:GDP-mannose 4,6-dehydratase [Candidatus Woesearchaeota archaeon]|nr:GDP-mannose 4,6-dehydratase [Candidatus Woesearchaeota archaeon]
MKALITGITGQDGSYLAELLLEKGYEVHGIRRYASTNNLTNIGHIADRIHLHYADMTDIQSLDNAVKEAFPDEVYNLASLSFVGVSWSMPELVRDVNFMGVKRMLRLIQANCPNAKFYQASTSEMYGGVNETPQNEKTPFQPVSPYAEFKLRAHKAVQLSREKGLRACCGILFNHESPRRGELFVTRKITTGVARIASGEDYVLSLGNLNAVKDWGFAGDYVRAMWLMMQQEKPDDCVIGTGKSHTVREFVESAFHAADKQIKWDGEGLAEKGYLDGKCVVSVDPAFFRPVETKPFLADYSKARKTLGWTPQTSFEQLVEMMVKSDIDKLRSSRLV